MFFATDRTRELAIVTTLANRLHQIVGTASSKPEHEGIKLIAFSEPMRIVDFDSWGETLLLSQI